MFDNPYQYEPINLYYMIWPLNTIYDLEGVSVFEIKNRIVKSSDI